MIMYSSDHLAGTVCVLCFEKSQEPRCESRPGNRAATEKSRNVIGWGVFTEEKCPAHTSNWWHCVNSGATPQGPAELPHGLPRWARVPWEGVWAASPASSFPTQLGILAWAPSEPSTSAARFPFGLFCWVCWFLLLLCALFLLKVPRLGLPDF